MNKYHTYDFPDCKCLVVCGDIRGDFNLLVNKVCVQYQMKDTLVIVAGDCGFGFFSSVATMTIQLTLTERHSGIKGLLAFPTTL